MFITLSWILIIIALIVILFIVVKKFPALAILNVSDLPGEKEAKFKEEIIKTRVSRDLASVGGFFGRIWLAIIKKISAILKERQTQLKKLQTTNLANLKISWHDKQKKIKELAAAAEEDLKKEDEAGSEEKLLAIVSLDQKNLEAFFALGNLYGRQKKWPEARETYEYALKLAGQAGSADQPAVIPAQEIYFSLASAAKEADDQDAALENIREALEREPNNPRYLDLILDLSIMRKDKTLAQEYLDKLAAVNPENQKLGEWAEKIQNL
ncbi:MAG: tetratricopeptide repeat protein [Patescibacteria group bacterium]